MRHADRPCEICGNSLPPTALAKRCPCGGRHRTCILCEMAQHLVEAGGPDTDTLRVCPDALAVAATLMREEPKAEGLPDDGHTHSMSVDSGPSLPAAGVRGQLFFRTEDGEMFQHDGARWVGVAGATP